MPGVEPKLIYHRIGVCGGSASCNKDMVAKVLYALDLLNNLVREVTVIVHQRAIDVDAY